MAAVVVLGAFVVSAGAGATSAPPATKLASYSVSTSVAGHRDTVVWNAYDDATERYTLTVWERGRLRPLPLLPRKEAIDASVGRGADGRPVIAYTDCPAGGRCGVYGLDPRQSRSRLLAASSQRSIWPRSPSVWRNRVVWVEDHGKPDRYTDTQRRVVYVAGIGGGPRSVVRRFARGRYVGATALLGQELALDVGPIEDGDEQIQVQRLDGTRRHVVGHTSSGEGQQGFVGLSFSGDALYWARVCGEGCVGTAFRYHKGRYAHARVPSSLAGFAVATSGVYWATTGYDDECDPAGDGETCDVERTSLTFKPGRDSHDGPGSSA